jgi:membrane protein
VSRRAYLVDLARPRSLADVVATTYEEWRVQRTVRLGAALAYYGLFAIVPVLALTLAVLSALFSGVDVDEVLNDLSIRLFDATPPESFTASVSAQLDELAVGTGLGLLGVVSLLLAGSLVFVALADAAALIWEVPVRRGVGVSIRRRLLSFAIVLGLGAVAVAAVVLRWVGGLLVRLLPSDVAVIDVVAEAAERAITVVVVGAVLALLFRVLAPATVDWLPLLIGGGLAGLVMVIGSDLFGIYLDKVFATSLTGAAAGVLVFLLWTYAMAQVVLAGMHLTRTLDERLERQGITVPERQFRSSA